MTTIDVFARHRSSVVRLFVDLCWIVMLGGCQTNAVELGLKFDVASLPERLVEPNRLFMLVGERLNVDCEGVDRVDTTVRWQSRDSNRLHFEALRRDDDGAYACVRHSDGATISMQLTVVDDAYRLESASNESLLLNCSSGGHLTLNGERVVGDLSESGLLLKPPIVGGIYLCNTTTRISMYQILTAPTVKQTMPHSKSLLEGERISLKCPIGGFPLATITWSKSNLTIEPSDHVVFSKFEDHEAGMLTIGELTFADQGDYTCRAVNSVGECELTLTVVVKDKLAALWPFLAIVVEVLIVVSIIFVYERRSASKEENIDDGDEENEEKRALNDAPTAAAADVRQRSTKT